MHQKEAVKILTTELVRHSDISIVRDDWYKEKLIENAKYFTQFSNPIVVDYKYVQSAMFEDGSEGNPGRYFLNTEQCIKGNKCHIHLENLLSKIDCKGANYFFVDCPVYGKPSEYPDAKESLHFFITPYSIIGEDEINDIREIFYKDAPANIICAMDALEIKNYSEIYEQYLKQDGSNINFMNSAIWEFMKLVPNLKFCSDGDLNLNNFDQIGGISSLNSILNRLGLKSQLNTKDGREEECIKKYPHFIHQSTVLKIAGEIKEKFGDYDYSKNRNPDLLDEFNNFIFTLPYEDQNIENNKIIIKLNACYLDYLKIMEKEYTKGRHFQEYFNCLNDGQQRKVVSCLNVLPEKNLANDSFLWSKGFKDVTLDYMDLYQKDAAQFIEYFGSRAPEDKRIILKDIMKCDYTNKSVAEWLDEHELDLMRGVSMDG